MPFATILLSRQPLHPCGKTPWVQNAVKAIEWVKQNADGLYTSVGMQTWELLVMLSQQYNLKQKIVIPVENKIAFNQQCHFITNQFNLHSGQAEYIPLYPETSTDLLQKQRDTFIVSHADILIPVSIREKGGMQRLLTDFTEVGKHIVTQFQCAYAKRSSPIFYDVKNESLNPELSAISNRYLIHWTRASNSAWPDETLYEYYTAVVSSETYPKNAFATLEHILSSRRIIASSRHMPGNIPTVSFSGAPPNHFFPLMRYRARYRQMSFEPYGIGIEKEFARSIGIRRVLYYDKSEKNTTPQSDEWLTQSSGVKSDWRQEDEYRHLGDVDLSRIPKDKLCCFCFKTIESNRLSNTFNLNTISFTQ